MSLAYKSFTLNDAGDPPPWGAVEQQVLKDIIDTMVEDCVEESKSTGGHHHFTLYSKTNNVKSLEVDTEGRIGLNGVTPHTDWRTDQTASIIQFNSSLADYPIAVWSLNTELRLGVNVYEKSDGKFYRGYASYANFITTVANSMNFYAADTAAADSEIETTDASTLHFMVSHTIGTVVNYAQGDFDFAVRTEGQANTFTIDGEYHKIGIGISAGSADGKVHIHEATAGTIAADEGANTLILENSAAAGLTILTPDASTSNIYFGSPSAAFGGFLNWNYNGQVMTIGTNKADADLVFYSDASKLHARLDHDGYFSLYRTTDDSTSSKIYIDKLRGTGQDDDDLFHLYVRGDNDADEVTQYGFIHFAAADVSDADEAGVVTVAAMKAGVANGCSIVVDGDNGYVSVPGGNDFTCAGRGAFGSHGLVASVNLAVEGDCRFGDVSDHYVAIGGTDEQLTLVGNSRVKKTVNLDMASFLEGSTPPTKTNIHDAVGFAFTIDDDAPSRFRVPEDWDTTQGIEIIIRGYIDEAYATNSGEIKFEVGWTAVDANESETIDSATHTGTNSISDKDIPTTAKRVFEINFSEIAAANIQYDDTIYLRFKRVALGGGNNPTAEPVITDAYYKYVSNKLGAPAFPA